MAIVAPTDIMFGIARIYQSASTGDGDAKRYFVCRTMEEARAWLSLPERPLEK